MRVADARTGQTCGGVFGPPCSTTSTSKSSTTTTEDEETTTTTEDDGSVDEGTDDGATDDGPTTTERRTTTSERVTTTTFTVSTSVNLLVPGDGTAGAESTTTTEQGSLVESDSGLTDNQLVALIVGGSTALAAAVALLTWRYWRATQPVEVPVEPADASNGPRRGPGGRTQRSVFTD